MHNPCHLYGLVMYCYGPHVLTMDDFGTLVAMSDDYINFHCERECWSTQ